jgi:replicative DNA helicase
MKFKPATESEKVVLGALILEPELFPIVDDILCSPDFHYPVHQEIYQCMAILRLKYGTFDIAMILDNLETDAAYLYELGNECPSTRNIEAHATIIREKSVQKKLMECVVGLKEEKCAHDYEEISLRPYCSENAVKYKCYKCGEFKDLNKRTLADLHERE